MKSRYNYEHSKKRKVLKAKAQKKFRDLNPNYYRKYYRSKNGYISFKKSRIKFKNNHPERFKQIHQTSLNKYLNDPLKHRCYLFVHQLKQIKFIYERCALCESNKYIQLHHPNYELPWHFYFICRKCHRIIHLEQTYNNRKILKDFNTRAFDACELVERIEKSKKRK